MATYRFYTIPVRGTRRPPSEGEYPNHGMAVQYARELSLVGATVEVWAGSALVGQIPPPDSYQPLTRHLLD